MHRRFICLKCNSVIVEKQTVASPTLDKATEIDTSVHQTLIIYLSCTFYKGTLKKHVNFYYKLVRIYFDIKHSVRRIKLKIRKTESSRCWKIFFAIFHKNVRIAARRWEFLLQTPSNLFKRKIFVLENRTRTKGRRDVGVEQDVGKSSSWYSLVAVWGIWLIAVRIYFMK